MMGNNLISVYIVFILQYHEYKIIYPKTENYCGPSLQWALHLSYWVNSRKKILADFKCTWLELKNNIRAVPLVRVPLNSAHMRSKKNKYQKVYQRNESTANICKRRPPFRGRYIYIYILRKHRIKIHQNSSRMTSMMSVKCILC